MPDHFLKLGTRYVNYQDPKKKENTIKKRKVPVKVKNEIADKKYIYLIRVRYRLVRQYCKLYLN